MKPTPIFYHLLCCFVLLSSTALQANSSVENTSQINNQSSACPRVTGSIIIGALEQVHLMPPGIAMVARIDSGAHTSSLDARDILVFQRDGLDWVSFVVIDRLAQKTYSMERPVVRWVQIKQSSSVQPQKRAVISLAIRLADKTQNAEFTLVNRSHLAHPVLVGRNVLQQGFLIDVSQKFTVPGQVAD